MSRYYWDKKEEVEFCKTIDVYWLNRHGYFKRSRHGGIEWPTKGESIGLITYLEQMYMKVYYTTTKASESHKVDYLVQLTTTPCNFGGVRYWFTCPFQTGGIACGKRVGVLYKKGKYFGCRHCQDLTYTARNLTSRSYYYILHQSWSRERKLESLYAEISRWKYNGKLTRKARRCIALGGHIPQYSKVS